MAGCPDYVGNGGVAWGSCGWDGNDQRSELAVGVESGGDERSESSERETLAGMAGGLVVVEVVSDWVVAVVANEGGNGGELVDVECVAVAAAVVALTTGECVVFACGAERAEARTLSGSDRLLLGGIGSGCVCSLVGCCLVGVFHHWSGQTLAGW